MGVGDSHMFPGFLTPVLTNCLSKATTSFFTCFSRGERRKYTGKKVCHNQVSDSQPPGHESDTLNTEPHGWVQNFKGHDEEGFESIDRKGER